MRYRLSFYKRHFSIALVNKKWVDFSKKGRHYNIIALAGENGLVFVLNKVNTVRMQKWIPAPYYINKVFWIPCFSGLKKWRQTFWTNSTSLSQFRAAAAIRFACHWTTNVMHWAGALSFGGASRGFVSLLEKWLYHGIIAPCGSFQTWSLALKPFHHYV